MKNEDRSLNYINTNQIPTAMTYYIAKTLNTDFDSAMSKTKEALQKEGFGVLSEINIHDKLKEKLDVDFRRYVILGACNPALAYEALKVEDKIGAMLPCNVILQQIDDYQVEIAAIDPFETMQVVANRDLSEIAKTVKEKLEIVIKNLH